MNSAQLAELRRIVSTIGLEEYMNAVLVQAGARPATLLEYGDYAEENLERRAQYISEKFPELYGLSLHNGRSFLLSKRPYTKEDIVRHDKLDHRKLGHILGLPCADDFESIKRNDDNVWVIDIHAYLNPGFDRGSIQLLANLCLTDETFVKMEDMAAQFYHVFHADPILKHVVQDVKALARTRMEFMAQGGKKKRQTKKTRKTRRKNRKRN